MRIYYFNYFCTRKNFPNGIRSDEIAIKILRYIYSICLQMKLIFRMQWTTTDNDDLTRVLPITNIHNVNVNAIAYSSARYRSSS